MPYIINNYSLHFNVETINMLTLNIKKQAWRDGSWIKSMRCPFIGTEFSSSQLPITAAPGDPTASSVLPGNRHSHVPIHTQDR